MVPFLVVFIARRDNKREKRVNQINVFNTITKFRMSMIYNYNGIEYEDRGYLFRMMDFIVVMALGVESNYRIPPIEDYLREYYENEEGTVTQFHEDFVKQELAKLGWTFEMKDLFFNFSSKEASSCMITPERWDAVTEEALAGIDESEATELQELLDEMAYLDEVDGKEMVLLDDVMEFNFYLIMRGPVIRPEIQNAEQSVLRQAMKRLGDMEYLHDYSTLSSIYYNEKETCVIMISKYCYNNGYDIQTDSELYYFPGVVLCAQDLQDIMLREEKGSG